MADTLHEFTAGPEGSGRRLDQYLTEVIPALSRARLQALVQAGCVTLNGAGTKSSVRLRPGDQLCVREPAPVPATNAAENIPLAVLWEDDALIVIDKPPGMVVHPAVGNREGTVVNALLHHCPTLSGIGGVQRPGIVHRLDKDTSGCLVAAKSDAAHQALARQFAGREVRKIYLALAEGRPRVGAGTIDAPLGRHPVHRQRMAVVAPGRGRTARTDWRVLAELAAPTAPGGITSLLECTLHTGRTHQIRVHLKHLGHPLLGDTVYGRPYGFPRQMLHAWQLGFQHPVNGALVSVRAPVPRDFLAAGVGEVLK